ncbi:MULTISPECIES: flagellar basal body rod protein FlgC [Salimicrobium]|uniref:Flagellar basal-body rod protein FlgC n=1 Tax=Salimicrobium humidisoli TaxID=2029857 RepID=A0ABX4HRM8_9BACI|nr:MULTISPECIES: flagellar basal body rod protein FlgC [Salimicrobium]PBB05866.1 flagellar basal body rod protein FlgC [Salimicrobium humidisoli]
MSIFHSINNSASGLTAQRLRMDLASSNIANADSTRATLNEQGEWEPYRRKMAVLEPGQQSFRSYLNHASGKTSGQGTGVRATKITEDDEPFKNVYRPEHPDADEDGYVQMPNVDPLREMTELMSATRSYEANITSMNASKSMLMKALEIGR